MPRPNQAATLECILMLERAGIVALQRPLQRPRGDNRILINIGSCPRSRSLPIASAHSISRAGVIDGKAIPARMPSALRIYRARADVKAVVHAHTKWTTF